MDCPFENPKTFRFALLEKCAIFFPNAFYLLLSIIKLQTPPHINPLSAKL